MLLFKDTLTYIVNEFTLNSQTTALEHMPEQNLIELILKFPEILQDVIKWPLLNIIYLLFKIIFKNVILKNISS